MKRALLLLCSLLFAASASAQPSDPADESAPGAPSEAPETERPPPPEPLKGAPSKAGLSKATPPKSAGDAPPTTTEAPPPALAVCPKGATCVPDDVLLAALLALEGTLLDGSAEGEGRAAVAVQQLGALKDPRAVPKLLRLSRQSAQRSVRLAALTALGELVHVDDARARLEQALLPSEPVEDAAAALPALMRAALADGRPSPLPCPEGRKCVPDRALLEALVGLESTAREELPAALARLGALRDPRALPTLYRWSHARQDDARHAALTGLGEQLEDERAKKRLFEVLLQDEPSEVGVVVESLAEAPGDDITDALFGARRRTQYPDTKVLLERVLEKRAPEPLAVLLEEERARLAAEAEAELPLFDWGNRGAVSGAAGLAGAYGGAAASSLVADQVLAGQGQGCLYGCYGCGVGCASAAALGWFALGDNQLTLHDTALGLSSALWGAYAGALIPLMIAGNDPNLDWRHLAYAAAGGQLVGLTAGVATSLFIDPDASDILELHTAVVTLNAAALGGLLTLSSGGDLRVLYGALFAGTIAGVAAGGALAPFVDFQAHETANLFATGAAGAGIGLLTGLSAAAFHPGLERPFGLTLLGGAAGLATSTALAAFDTSPSFGGSIYELWATASGASLGLGAGLMLEGSADLGGGIPPFALTAGLGAALGLTGAVSTAAFPDGIPQDLGDLALQPLLVGFSLYHATALLGAAGADPALVFGSAFAAPALASAAVTYSAPFIDNTLGDALMVAAMMGWGAWFSSMGTWSVASRAQVPPWAWVAVTAGAMDVGFMTGVGLGVIDNLLDVDRLGWKVTYVTSVAAGSTLLLALPGSLLALSTNGLVQVPDVLLVSSLLGAVAGLATMPLIDFRIVPELSLGEHVPVELPGSVEVVPTVVPLQPVASPSVPASEEVPLTLGVIGRY